jgi:hypothetical protein
MTKPKAEKGPSTHMATHPGAHPAKKADSYGCECGESTATPFDVCPRCGNDELKRIKQG